MNGLYVIHDSLLGTSGPVFEAKNDVVALRNFKITMKNVEFSEDFTLIQVGAIDHETNRLSAMPEPREVKERIDE